MSNNLVDVTVHIDEDLSPEVRLTIEDSIRALDGIVSVHNSTRTPHLTIVEYDMDEMDSQRILKRVTDQGVHAELIGL
ncbi:MAG: ATP-binding protein [Gammaproteobacteria bacterium]|nr:ATP-binding protein [Gammaproteobacteria bacterium]